MLLIEDPTLGLSPGSMWRCSGGGRQWVYSAFALSLFSLIVGAKDTHTLVESADYLRHPRKPLFRRTILGSIEGGVSNPLGLGLASNRPCAT